MCGSGGFCFLAADSLGFNIATAADGPDLFPFGGKVAVWLGRQGVAKPGYNQPSVFTGGKPWFVGYRMKHVRNASGRMQNFEYKFAGPWGFFMERHVFQKLWPSYDSVLNSWIAVDRSRPLRSMPRWRAAAPRPGSCRCAVILRSASGRKRRCGRAR